MAYRPDVIGKIALIHMYPFRNVQKASYHIQDLGRTKISLLLDIDHCVMAETTFVHIAHDRKSIK